MCVVMIGCIIVGHEGGVVSVYSQILLIGELVGRAGEIVCEACLLLASIDVVRGLEEAEVMLLVLLLLILSTPAAALGSSLFPFPFPFFPLQEPLWLTLHCLHAVLKLSSTPRVVATLSKV